MMRVGKRGLNLAANAAVTAAAKVSWGRPSSQTPACSSRPPASPLCIHRILESVKVWGLVQLGVPILHLTSPTKGLPLSRPQFPHPSKGNAWPPPVRAAVGWGEDTMGKALSPVAAGCPMVTSLSTPPLLLRSSRCVVVTPGPGGAIREAPKLQHAGLDSDPGRGRTAPAGARRPPQSQPRQPPGHH